MAKKGLSIKVAPDEIMHFGISVSKDGYKSARVLVKRGDKEYMTIGYEWEGEHIPAFVMDLMGFIKANEEDVNKSTEEKAEELASYKERK